MRPTGEPRVMYLYTKHGCHEATIDYINTKLGHAMTAVSPKMPCKLDCSALNRLPPAWLAELAM